MIDKAVIVAAGRGIRLGALIPDRPRAMLPVLGKPIIIRVMDRMREAGINKFVVVVGEHEGEVASYLNTSWVPDAKIQIVLQPFARGITDALACAASYLDGPFLFSTYDHLTPTAHITNLIRRFQDTNSDLMLSSVPANSDDAADLPTITLEESKVTGISENGRRGRHSLAAFMLLACNKRILNHLARNPNVHRGDWEMPHAIQDLIQAGGKVGYVNAEWHLHLNGEIDLLTINKRLLREDRDTHILSEVPSTVHITPPVRIDPKVSIGKGAKIGPNVYLESGAQVGQDAVIWDSIILRNAVVSDGEILHGQIVTRRARLSEPSTEPPEAETNRYA